MEIIMTNKYATIAELEKNWNIKKGDLDPCDIQCDFCSFETKDLHLCDHRGDEKAALCNVCYTTFAGNAYQYPDQYRNNNVNVMALIANCTNKMLSQKPDINSELLDALEGMIVYSGMAERYQDSDGKPLLLKAQAAIKKARGQS